ncbi:MAG: hypothetical protein MAG453_01814 [Calditrichaeota bacterium]|nr:hypothetical protein [Calditrichota bacterium]
MKAMRLVLTAVLLATFATPSLAGFGIHFNYDMMTIGEETKEFNFEGQTELANLQRLESTSPIGGGVDFTFGLLPIVDLMLSVEGAYGSYETSYETPDDNVSTDAPFLRAGADLTGTVTVFSFPPIAKIGSVYAGGGPSFMMVAPVFSEGLVKDNFDSIDDKVDPADLADDVQAEFGVHFTAGVKLDPTGLPFSFRVAGKYYMIPTLEEPAPTSWLTVQAGIAFGG